MLSRIGINLLVAAAAVVGALLIRWIASPWLHGGHPYAPMFAAIAIATVFGGAWVGITVMIAGPIAVLLLFMHSKVDVAAELGAFATYAIGSTVIMTLAEKARRMRARAESASRETEEVRGKLRTESVERRRSEQALLREKELLQSIFDTIPVMIAIRGPQGRIQRVNREFERRAGWTSDDARSRPLDDEIFLDHEQRRQMMECRGDHDHDWSDMPLRTRKGETIQTSWTSIRLSDGTCVSLGLDITERLRADAELRLSESRFRHVADWAPVMIWVSDENAKCTWVNRPWLEFTGRTVEEELGDGWKTGVHPDDVPLARRVFQKAFEARAPFTFEYRHRRKDGVFRWLENYGMPQYGPDGLFSGYIGTCLDVNDRKATEERLRTADRVKDEFLATLAHELRNPLAPIRNALAVIGHSPGESREGLRAREIIDRQVRRMSRLVDDLLDVSRITRGIVPLRRERVSLESLVTDAVEAARPRIAAQQHQLEVHLPHEPLTLYADPTRLSQVLANLLDNAAKYTRRGGQIEVSAWREDEEVAISVRDTGVGIPSEHLQQIFEMFSRGAAADLAQGGLGIGLWLAKKLVELHSGTIYATSAGPGRGSEFLVRLPLAAETEGARRVVDDAVLVPSAGPRMKVLVVEDNADAAESMEMLLNQMGHDVRVASDGRSGLHLAETERPDVVLLDIGLPELNGFEVARRIRLQPWGDRMALVALTGWGQEEDKRRSRDAGFDHHLVKPVDPAALGSLLESLRSLVRYR